MLTPRFREDKATQLAGLFLLLAGGEVDRMRLLKLMYITDRTAIKRWGWPVTFDRYVSMKNGPVLSCTYNLIKGDLLPPVGDYWGQYMTNRGHRVVLQERTPDDDLSDAEVELAKWVFKRCDPYDTWDLSDKSHAFPEWKDPGDSAISISLESLLLALEKPELEVQRILNEMHSRALDEQALEH